MRGGLGGRAEHASASCWTSLPSSPSPAAACPASLPECSYRSELAQYHQVQQKSLQGDTWCVRAAGALLSGMEF